MRVLFSPLSILHSHVSRCLATAEALIGQGHQAAFVAGVQGRALIEMAGFHCYPGCDPPFAAVVAAGAPRAYRQMFEQLAPEVKPVRFCFGDHLAAELAAIDAFDPDLLVTDNSLAGPLAAQLRGLRRAEIRNLAGLASHREERAGASAESAPDLAKIFYRLLQQATAGAGALPPAAVIVPGYRFFDKPEAGAKEPFFAGHLGWEGWRRLDDRSWQRDLDPLRPTVFVTLGSSLPFPQVFQGLVAPLVGAGFQVLANGGPLHRELERIASPGSLVVRQQLDVQAAMETASVAIFHGGHGTAMEALLSATPSLLVPFNGDQWGVARRWQKLGLGQILVSPPWQVDGAEVVSKVRLLQREPSFSRRLRALRPAAPARRNGPLQAVAHLEQELLCPMMP